MISTLNNERNFIGTQFQELLQQLDLLCLPETNNEIQKILVQIPSIHQHHQQIVSYNLEYIKQDFWQQMDDLQVKLKSFRQDIYYFAALVSSNYKQDAQIRANASILQQMAESIFKATVNMLNCKQTFAAEAAAKRSVQRQTLKSPNLLNISGNIGKKQEPQVVKPCLQQNNFQLTPNLIKQRMPENEQLEVDAFIQQQLKIKEQQIQDTQKQKIEEIQNITNQLKKDTSGQQIVGQLVQQNEKINLMNNQFMNFQQQINLQIHQLEQLICSKQNNQNNEQVDKIVRVLINDYNGEQLLNVLNDKQKQELKQMLK